MLRPGEVAEWPIAPVLKTGVPQGTESSNLSLSALNINRSYSRNPFQAPRVDQGYGCQLLMLVATCVPIVELGDGGRL